MERSARKFSLEREIPLPRAQVWQLLSHTDHLNRAIGLPVVDFEPVVEGDTTLSRLAFARLAGLTMRWHEFPFDWVREKCYSVVRVYESGPIKRFEGGLELSDAATGLPDGSRATRLLLTAEFQPATTLGTLLIPIVAQRFLNRTYDYCRQFIEQHESGRSTPVPPVSPGSAIDTPRLEHLLNQLAQQPVERGAIALLGLYLRERADDEVAAIRPYELADEWNCEPDAVLRLCLHATRIGLLNLSWNLMCPNCRVAKTTESSLADVTEQFHCDLCGVTYNANFDRYVELKFAVHPGVRQASENVYCVGGPFMSPHILVQRPLRKGGETIFEYPETTDILRLRVLRLNHTAEFDEHHEGGANTIAASYNDNGWEQTYLARPVPGARLQITNRSSSDIVLALEKVEWDVRAVTAAKVTAMQEFRDLFSSEVLAPGQHVGIESLTLFFTDLRDSTVMYERLKDAPAYNRVRRHFDFLFEHIGANNGSIVKTIGDAVMAVFYTPEDALRAALEVQCNICKLNATLFEGHELVIRIGLHHGPAIAINSNDRLDYFGRTVNIAARVEAASNGNDIVMSQACYERENVQAILAEYSAAVGKFESSLKGIEGAFNLYRVHLNR